MTNELIIDYKYNKKSFKTSVVVKYGLNICVDRVFDKMKAEMNNYQNTFIKLEKQDIENTKAECLLDLLEDLNTETFISEILNLKPFNSKYIDLDGKTEFSYMFQLEEDNVLIILNANINTGFNIKGFYVKRSWDCDMCCGGHHTYDFITVDNYISANEKVSKIEMRDINIELELINVDFKDNTIKNLLK